MLSQGIRWTCQRRRSAAPDLEPLVLSIDADGAMYLNMSIRDPQDRTAS